MDVYKFSVELEDNSDVYCIITCISQSCIFSSIRFFFFMCVYMCIYMDLCVYVRYICIYVYILMNSEDAENKLCYLIIF